MKWMTDTPLPHPSPIPVAKGSASFSPVAKGSASFSGIRDPSQSTCAVSDDDFFNARHFFNALADEDFDLLQLTEEKRPGCGKPGRK